MNFIDLFAGAGGIRMGMEMAGHTCIGFCEIDPHARAAYKAIFETAGEVEFHDITAISNEEFRCFRGHVDIICAGFPCQAFSKNGRRGGFEDTRGTLFFDVARAAREIEPRFLFLENVPGLLSHDNGHTFARILSTLDELGYDAEWYVRDSAEAGVPQQRQRTFIIGHHRKCGGSQIFPFIGANGQADH